MRIMQQRELSREFKPDHCAGLSGGLPETAQDWHPWTDVQYHFTPPLRGAVTSRRERQRGQATETERQLLVGRRDCLRVLDKTLDRAAKGGFHLVELVGEPGVGKSRLLAETVAAARARGMLALLGRASEFERDAPLAAFADAVDDHLETLGDRQLSRLTDADRKLLGAVFAGIATESPADGAGIGSLRYRLFRTVRGLLELLAESDGLVLVLDDVHWADESSVELLDHLLRHPPRGRVVLAVAYRPSQVSAQVTTALGMAGPGRRVRIDVEPLSEEETAEFLGPEVNRTRRRWLYEASGGNPFYLEALSRMDGSQVPIPREAAGPVIDSLTEVPDPVRAALLLELTSLTSIGQLVARAAAVVGDEFEPAAVAAAGAIGEDEALSALDELVARDVVRPDTGRFRFRHPLVRHAAYAAAKPGWRMTTHARAAKFLRGRGAQPQMLAHHVVGSAQFGDRESVAELAAAAQAVASRAPATAAHWLRNALRLLPETAETIATQVNLLLRLSTAHLACGQLREGRETARKVLTLLPPDDLARRAPAARLCATTERMLGSREAAKAVLLTELRRLPDPVVVDAAPLYLRLAVEHVGTGDSKECARMLDEMTKMELDPPTAFAASALRVMPAYIAGDMSAALAALDEVDRLMPMLSVAEITPWMDTTAWLCWGELMVGRHRSALARLDQVTEIARSTGQQFVLSYLLAAKAFALGRAGGLAEAMQLSEEAADLARLVNSGEALTMALTSHALVLAWAGEYPAALKAASESAQASQPSKVYWSVLAGCARSLVLIYSRDLAAGRPDVEAACAEFESDGVRDETLLLICLEAIAHAEAMTGGSDTGLTLVDRADAIRHPEHELNAAIAGLIRAHAVGASDPAASAELALRAADTLAHLDFRLEEGRARLRAGLSLAANGKRAEGLAQLAIAAELFTMAGARGLHAQVTEAQRRLGQRVPVPRGGRRPELPFGLSTREMEVALLVVEGRTNAQIAERLSLSLRTVETHLTRVFAKTEVPARGGLGWVLAQYLDPP
jgi:DNA-binding CsgD family transcriptional regulator/tetratricopeptide (TPR) repeat protein